MHMACDVPTRNLKSPNISAIRIIIDVANGKQFSMSRDWSVFEKKQCDVHVDDPNPLP